MLPASPLIEVPLEPYASREPATSCIRGMEQPGVAEFRDWVIGKLGGSDYGVARPCERLPLSHHHEGRAWDWKVSADDPADVARVEALLGWLLAPGPSGEHEMFRRAGLRYIIWNKRIFSSGTRQWKDHAGSHPHTDHVHLSFGWPGARGETSFFDWLLRGSPARPPSDPSHPAEPQGGVSTVLPLMLGAAVGLGLSVAALKRIER